MHIDLGHAIITALLVWGTIEGMRRTGMSDPGHGKFDWKIVVAIAVVIFVFNLIWPGGPAGA